MKDPEAGLSDLNDVPLLSVTYRTGRTSTPADTAILAVEGDVDIISAPLLQAALEQALASGQNGTMPIRLLLDMTGVEFIDSIGTEVLKNAVRRFRAESAPVELSPEVYRVGIWGASVQVKRIIQLLGMANYIGVYADEAEALEGGDPDQSTTAM